MNTCQNVEIEQHDFLNQLATVTDVGPEFVLFRSLERNTDIRYVWFNNTPTNYIHDVIQVDPNLGHDMYNIGDFVILDYEPKALGDPSQFPATKVCKIIVDQENINAFSIFLQEEIRYLEDALQTQVVSIPMSSLHQYFDTFLDSKTGLSAHFEDCPRGFAAAIVRARGDIFRVLNDEISLLHSNEIYGGALGTSAQGISNEGSAQQLLNINRKSRTKTNMRRRKRRKQTEIEMICINDETDHDNEISIFKTETNKKFTETNEASGSGTQVIKNRVGGFKLDPVPQISTKIEDIDDISIVHVKEKVIAKDEKLQWHANTNLVNMNNKEKDIQIVSRTHNENNIGNYDLNREQQNRINIRGRRNCFRQKKTVSVHGSNQYAGSSQVTGQSAGSGRVKRRRRRRKKRNLAKIKVSRIPSHVKQESATNCIKSEPGTSSFIKQEPHNSSGNGHTVFIKKELHD